MKTFRGILVSGTGPQTCVLVGESVPDAIRKTWERKYSCTVLSISLSGETNYHIEHEGREVSIVKNYGWTTVKMFSDEIREVVEIETL